MSSRVHNSTGARTEAGKARSAQNARTHGLTAKELIMAPKTPPSTNPKSIRKAPSSTPCSTSSSPQPGTCAASAAWKPSSALQRRVPRQRSYPEKVGSFDPPQDPIERTFHRSLRELKALQTNTALVPLLPRPIAEKSPAPASASQIAKRTQHLQRGGNADMLRTVLQAIDNEANAFLCATRAKTRIEELEKSVAPPVQAA